METVKIQLKEITILETGDLLRKLAKVKSQDTKMTVPILV